LTLPVLQVDDLSFSYPGRPVFTGWQHAFGPGVTWVRGSNGSGKSTLLKLLVGALPALTGRFALNGQATDPNRPEHRLSVYWCGPGAVAFDHLRPAEFFGFLLGLYPCFDTVAAQELAVELGLTPFLDRRLREMSTGTQRKVWLSAAFCAGTPVVLLDEPLNALDMRSVRVVRERLARCAQNPATAWIVVSHEGLGEAEAQAAMLTLVEVESP
jgi:ABC-type multidrug transport system ATPase subunit